ncbi:MAG: hypothetical protein ACYC4J_02730 [Gemmatimonadaceae bacterium]
MRSITVTLIASVVLATPALAQRGARENDRGSDRDRDSIPAAYHPPAGMCRIWVSNVPPAQQPAPTDCASAIKKRPANGRVVFGDDYAKRGAQPWERKAGEALKGFFGARAAPEWRKVDKPKPKKPDHR